MRQYGFEFTLVDAIDQPQPNFKVLFDGKKHAPKTGVVEYSGIDRSRQINSFWKLSIRFFHDFLNQCEQLRFVRRFDFDQVRAIDDVAFEDEFD